MTKRLTILNRRGGKYYLAIEFDGPFRLNFRHLFRYVTVGLGIRFRNNQLGTHSEYPDLTSERRITYRDTSWELSCMVLFWTCRLFRFKSVKIGEHLC